MATPAARSRRQPRRGLRPFTSERALYRLFLAPLVLLLLLLTVYPLAYSLYTSTTDLILSRPRQVVEFVGLRNYLDVFGNQHFRIVVANTFILITAAVSLQFLLGSALALLLDRPMKGVGVIRTALLIPMMITPVVSALAFYSMYNPTYGIFNVVLRAIGITHPPEWLADPRTAMLSIVIADVWQWTPLVMLLALAGLHTVPRDFYEVAEVEGATFLQTLRFITVPYLKPLIGVILLIRGMDAFKIFDKIYILTGGGPGTLTETVTFFAYREGFGFFRMGYATTLSVVILLMVVAASVVLIRLTQRTEAP